MFLIKLPDSTYLNVVAVCATTIMREFSDNDVFFNKQSFSDTVAKYFERTQLGDVCKPLFDNYQIYLDQNYLLSRTKDIIPWEGTK